MEQAIVMFGLLKQIVMEMKYGTKHMEEQGRI